MLTDIRDALVDGRPALASHAFRRGHRFAGRNVDAPIFEAAVTEDGELEWVETEFGHRLVLGEAGSDG
jgi:hypothetical protein